MFVVTNIITLTSAAIGVHHSTSQQVNTLYVKVLLLVQYIYTNTPRVTVVYEI